MNNPSAVTILSKALDLLEERAKQYDSPGGERSMAATIECFNIITGKDLSEAEGWLIMELLKNVRMWKHPGYHADSAEDCVTYAALKAEAKSKESTEFTFEPTPYIQKPNA